MKKRAIVVGGGMAGMAAATNLTEGGASVTVLEKQPYLGGRYSTPVTQTIEHHGKTWSFPVEHGIHGFWRQYRNMFALLERHGLRKQLRDSGKNELVFWAKGDKPRFVEVGDRVRQSKLPEPFCFMELIRDPEFFRLALKGGPKMLQVSWDMTHAFAFDPDRDMDEYEKLSVGQWIGGWPDHMRWFFTAMTHSSFFVEAEQASLGAFLASLHHYTICDKRDIGFDYMDGSTQECVLDPLSEYIEGGGGRVLTENTVEEVLFEDGKAIGVRAKDKNGRSRVLKADAVVIALDPPGMAKLRHGELENVLSEVFVPRGVHSMSVRLWFDTSPAAHRAETGMFAGPAINNYFWLSKIQRSYKAWAAETGGSCIEAHIYGANAEAAKDLPDDEVIARAQDAVETCWPNVRGRLIEAHLKRNPPTHVEFNPGTLALLPEVETRCPNLALAGDWVKPKHNVLYLERTASTGLQAAHALVDALELDRSKLADVLPPHEASTGFKRYQAIARGIRDLGLLPDLSKRPHTR